MVSRIAVLKRSLAAYGRLFWHKPGYVVLAVLVAMLFIAVLAWLPNSAILNELLLSLRVGTAMKLQIITEELLSAITRSEGMLLVIVALVQGVVVAGITYCIRTARQFNKATSAQLGGVGVAGILATLGLGCAACGTSLLAPIVLLLTGSASAIFIEIAGVGVMIASLIVGLVTLVMIGKKIADYGVR